ncbi:MAG TPA: efflux RND transporter periplasmic adaptor subunit [Parvularculaceae bacterium]|nr:efflux RND transporter periplasmic adaptor subunit [Parvularculaceae bacterium]
MREFFITGLAALAVAACNAKQSEDANRATNTDATSQSNEAPHEKGKILYYKNAMGLPDTSPVPKKDSMGMDYIPVYEGDVIEASDAIALQSGMIQTIGVKTALAREETFSRTVRAYGSVEPSTRLQTVVSARVEGWIEDLAVAAIGDEVKKGDLLFRLYSPDLIAAEQDFLSAIRAGSEGRAQSAMRRLKSLGLQDETINALRKNGSAGDHAPFYADRDGVIAALNVREGSFVKPGGEIATIQNYSAVWVIASLAEQDLAAVSKGAAVDVDFPEIAGDARRGTVDYVYPTVDSKTRTGKARIVLDNPDDQLRPGAYANVTVPIEDKPRLAVPSEAVLHDSNGAHVIIALGDGKFAPADVETGVVAMGRTEIVAGLKSGDSVVVSGQFLLDSESSLREAFRKLTPVVGEPPSESTGTTPQAGAKEMENVDGER